MPPTRLRNTTRGIFRLGLTVLVMGCALLASLSLRPNSSDARRARVGQFWSRAVLRALGLHLECIDSADIQGDAGVAPTSAPAGGSLVVCNHISFLDILVINALLPSRFVSKSDVSAWPLMGGMARRVQTIFIERGSRRAAHRTQELILQCLRAGQRVAIFPEGTTTAGITMLPFHSALFQSAIDANAQVRPLSLAYLNARGQPSLAAAYIGDTSMLQCLWQVAREAGLRARVRVHVPVPAGAGERRHLAHHVHQIIAHGCHTPHSDTPSLK